MNRGQPLVASKAVLEPRNSIEIDGVGRSRWRKASVLPEKQVVRRSSICSRPNNRDGRENKEFGRRRGFNSIWKPDEKSNRRSGEENPKRTEQRVHIGSERFVADTGADSREDMGSKYDAQQAVSLGPTADLGRTERRPGKPGYGSVICDGDEGVKAGNASVRQSLFRNAKENGIGERDIETISSGVESRRSGDSVGTSKTNRSPQLDCMVDETRCEPKDWFTDRVEDGSKMGRSMETGEAEFYFHFCEGNSCRLVGCPEGAKGRSIQAVQMGSDKGISYSGDCTGSAGDGRFRESYKGDDERSRCNVEEGKGHGKIFSPLNKKGRDFSYNGINVDRRSSRRDCVGKAAEAFIEERSVLSSHDKIWRKPSGHGSCAGMTIIVHIV